MDWVIDFSELGPYIDQPFHTYSSGMQARLTFATAMSVDPDILIVDEALATGDAAFVQKCLGRIRKICEGGATVLFVSHSNALVQELCHRAIWLDRGAICAIGPARDVAKQYEASVWRMDEPKILEANRERNKQLLQKADSKTESANSAKTEPLYELTNNELRIVDYSLLDRTGQARSVFEIGETAILRVSWRGRSLQPQCLGRNSNRFAAPQCRRWIRVPGSAGSFLAMAARSMARVALTS